MAEWSDKFNTLKSIEFPMSENAIWKCSIEEHKTKGTLQINARLWTVSTKEGGYNGPSKSGFIIHINSVEDIDKISDLFKQWQDLITSTKELM